MVKRVDTFFFRLVRADTHMLHKSVGQYFKIILKESGQRFGRVFPVADIIKPC